MGRDLVELRLSNNEDLALSRRGMLAPESVRQARLQGIVDSGATRLVLPETVVAQLGFPSAGETTVRFADLRTATRAMVKDVSVTLAGRESVFTAIVEPGRTDALVGAIVLEELDLLIDCTTQTLHPRDPDRIISEVE